MLNNGGKQEEIDTINHFGYNVSQGKENYFNVKLNIFPNL
jgi:hypothetical protein